MCTRTLFGKAEIVLWRQATDVFRLEVWRSFSLYVVQMLHEVAREL
jgi:sarcosine oxidase subunit gamma